MRRLIFILILLEIIFSCKENIFNTKPRMYPKLVLPDKKYIRHHSTDCPFEFDFPVYSSYEKDSSFFDTLAGPCWFNVNFEKFNAKIYCTYSPLSKKSDLSKYINETYKLVNGHMIKADYIDEYPIKKPNQVYGMIYEIEGPSATPFQFYLTDSSSHFLRGALYFNTHINPDSLAPYYEFTKIDVLELINTFSWK
ncbi:MAG: hypothetical protein ABI851_01120 [Saprospiraceae bacterium]